jgi:hypothetical protein
MAAFALLAGCGHKDDAAPQPTASAAAEQDNSQGGRCGDHVSADYRDLNEHCRSMRSREQARQCRFLAEDFLRKYPAVSCVATERDERTGAVRERRVEARDVKVILERLRRIGV